MTAGAAFAQTPPHVVQVFPIVYSDGSTTVLAVDMHYDAWMTERPGEHIIRNGPDEQYFFDGALQVELSEFPTPWAAGNHLMLTITGDGSNYTQAETQTFGPLVITAENPQTWIGEGPNNSFVLPVELTSFSANTSDGKVTLSWITASEVENIGFNVLRSTEREGAFARINDEMIPGAGTSTETHSYSYVDESIEGGLYFYQLEAVATNGDKQLSEIVEVHPTPTVFALSAGYPNPMVQSTDVAFQLPKEGLVSVRVYNMAGREVSILQQGTLQAGYYSRTWNGTDADGRTVGNGVYFVRMDAQGFNATKKLVVLR
jgi:hypothetical protein